MWDDIYGYRDQRSFNDLSYSGILKNGKAGTGIDPSAFTSIDSALEGGNKIGATSKRFLPNMNGGEGFSLLGGSRPDGNGGIIKDNGLLGPAMSAFSAYNQWDQGNKMYDLQRDAFDFSKDKFWNNYAQQSWDANIARNERNRAIEWKNKAIGMDFAEQSAMTANQSNDYNQGHTVRGVDGSSTMVGGAVPSKYASSTTPAPVAAPAPAAAATSAMAIKAPQSTGIANSKALNKPDPKKQTL